MAGRHRQSFGCGWLRKPARKNKRAGVKLVQVGSRQAMLAVFPVIVMQPRLHCAMASADTVSGRQSHEALVSEPRVVAYAFRYAAYTTYTRM